MEEVIFCSSGCGREGKFQFKNGNWCCENHITKCPANRMKYAKFGKDHHLFGKRPSEETIQKVVKAHTGVIFSEETKRKMGDSKRGEKNHNYKSGKFPEKAQEKIRLNPPMKGKHHSKESIIKMRNSHLGPKSYNYGKRPSEEVIIKAIETKIKNGNMIPKYLINDFYLYNKLVWKYTERSIKLKFSKEELKKRSFKDHQIDHILSIFEGFCKGILPTIIGHPSNIRLIRWEENNKKWKRSNVTLEELFESITNFEKGEIKDVK